MWAVITEFEPVQLVALIIIRIEVKILWSKLGEK